MAKQKGIVKLSGTIGDVSFYKSQDGFLAREKGGIDKERIKNDPAFQRTRENGQEFGRACKAGRLLRTTFRMLLQNSKDRLVTSRLTKSMMQVIKSDPTNLRGERTIKAGDQSKLMGFDFNVNSKLGSTFYSPYEVAMNRETGAINVTIAEFVPEQMLTAPIGVTHFSIVSGAAIIDYSTETFEVSLRKTEDIPINNQLQSIIQQVHELSSNSEGDMYVTLGREFVEIVNGIRYPLKGTSTNCLCIVGLEQSALSE